MNYALHGAMLDTLDEAELLAEVGERAGLYRYDRRTDEERAKLVYDELAKLPRPHPMAEKMMRRIKRVN